MHLRTDAHFWHTYYARMRAHILTLAYHSLLWHACALASQHKAREWHVGNPPTASIVTHQRVHTHTHVHTHTCPHAHTHTHTDAQIYNMLKANIEQQQQAGNTIQYKILDIRDVDVCA